MDGRDDDGNACAYNTKFGLILMLTRKQVYSQVSNMNDIIWLYSHSIINWQFLS